jgi:hypothetical protein
MFEKIIVPLKKTPFYAALKKPKDAMPRVASFSEPGSSGEPHTVCGAGRAISGGCGSRAGDADSDVAM